MRDEEASVIVRWIERNPYLALVLVLVGLWLLIIGGVMVLVG